MEGETSRFIAFGYRKGFAYAKHGYPIRRVNRHLAANSQTIVENSIFSGELPRRVAVLMVDSEGVYGSFRKNPFKLEHCNISEIALIYGDEYVPTHPSRCDWDQCKYSFPFIYLCEGCDMANTNRGAFITYEDFKNGYTIFQFDLTANNVDVGAMQLIREGDLSLFMQLKEPISGVAFPQGVEMLICCEFDNLVSIDKNRTPFFEYAV